MQWVPVGLATLGVIYLTVNLGQLPWIALALATSFGLYGLVKKISPLNSLHSLTVETGILLLPAILFLLLTASRFTGTSGEYSSMTYILLAGTGVATSVPLLLFGAAARRIDLSLMGILQYIAPTCQLFLGVLIYGEPFTHAKLVGFSFVWAALILFWVEGFLQHRRMRLAAAAT
jgi:chloramphenicol-sensitive protein RarD